MSFLHYSNTLKTKNTSPYTVCSIDIILHLSSLSFASKESLDKVAVHNTVLPENPRSKPVYFGSFGRPKTLPVTQLVVLILSNTLLVSDLHPKKT